MEGLESLLKLRDLLLIILIEQVGVLSETSCEVIIVGFQLIQFFLVICN